MSARELVAAGIEDPALRRSYEACRRLNASHGRTYYLATLLLPPAKRPYVHALYGFARYADEIVDDLDSTLTDEQKADWLVGWGSRFLAEVRAFVDEVERADYRVLDRRVAVGPARRVRVAVPGLARAYAARRA